MHLERLRLAGFKSFVDATELAIEPGLTGIVGPNGCGKSNLVEALRWVMGEASAKRLRGGEMDDVIFAGSADRSARNIAEVVVTLDNSARTAPAAFGEHDTIEIVRRIERGAGSAYRIDGREARARDVQLLFADAATGPHSGALVSQGRIAALIAAKPAERRLLLDEAAGTAGLHARRHEAELRLKATEDNLSRLDDVTAAMAQQLDALKKQARQAQRYRRLADQIRRLEAQLLDLRWRAAAAAAERIETELRAAERAVAAATEHAVAEERRRAGGEAELPGLRLAEASAGAALRRLTEARAALEQELSRILTARGEAERRREQVGGDLAREDENLADAETSLTRLDAERRGLESGEGRDAAARDEAGARLAEAAAALAAAEAGSQQMTEACAAGAARRGALERRRRELADRRVRLEARLADGERQRNALSGALVASEAVEATAVAVAAAAGENEAARAAVAAAREALTAALGDEAATVDAAREAERALTRLRAEAEALASVLSPVARSGAISTATSLLSQLQVPTGFEAAVAALFDGELSTPAMPGGGGTGWVDLGPLAAEAELPAGARPLAAEIVAPAVLARRLGQTGWVDSEAAGRALQPRLRAGQSLVDRDGRLWRWDGFARAASGHSATAEQLRQRNRLAALGGETATAAETASRTETQAAAARRTREQAAAVERSGIDAWRAAEQRLAAARAAAAELAGRALAAETRLAALNEGIEKLAAELTEIAAQSAEAERGLAVLPDPGLARTGLETARGQAAAARRREGDARAALDRLAQEAETRRRRLAAIAAETESWRQRRDRAVAQKQILAERRRALDAEIAELAVRPATIAAETEALARNAGEAVTAHRAAADALAAAETRLKAAGDTTRRAEQAVSEARETRARLEAQREAAAEAAVRLRDEIRERLDRTPESLAELADPGGEATPAVPGEIAARLDRLLRERDGIGAVNLVAEAEAAEVEVRLTGLQSERAELTEAIVRLRRGIGALDQEGRKRLLAAFDTLNGHFAELFARLFGGGKAHLSLVDADDPFDAGLEIMASPPGKRLQSLSLLSGGEQALTAIALIFAVFLTNPAPICVLDEVDAPLDDANVDRFCRLLGDTADATGTRFLVVTHHRITMARMDRLFGVTMPERGVSQLVSVDLARAAEMRQTA